MKDRGFTLIELLVVIAIIAVLAAILFPVFAQAKMAAKKTADLAQIKQVGTGVHLYLGDNDDTYPMSTIGDLGPGASGHVRWSSRFVVQPYIKSGAIFLSPGDPSTLAGITPAMKSSPQFVDFSKVYVNSYMANALNASSENPDDFAYDPLERKPDSQGALFGSGPGSDDNYAIQNIPQYIPTGASRVEFPSELIMLSDGATDVATYLGVGNTANTEMNVNDWDNDWFGVWMPLWFLGTYAYSPPPVTDQFRRYTGTANYAMADTSARSFRPGQLVKKGIYLVQHRWIVSPGE